MKPASKLVQPETEQKCIPKAYSLLQSPKICLHEPKQVHAMSDLNKDLSIRTDDHL